MRKKQFVPLMIAVMCLMLLLAACGSGDTSPTGKPDSAPPASGPLPTENLPEHWSAAEGGIAFDGQDWESYYLSSAALSDNDFQYAADVVFSDKDKGLAALVFQSSADHNDCYVASISALTNRAELYKVEQGLQIPLGTEIGLEDKGSYHLQVNMIDSHIAFFVDDTLICSTGDYIVASDLGQNDALMSGQLGLYGSDGEVAFQNACYNVYDEGGVPALTALSLQAQGGSLEAEGNMLANGWYIYQQYVSADCGSVSIQAETGDGVDAVILTDMGEAVSGNVSLNPGHNWFQIFTSAAEEGGESRYQLSYRLNVIRRGEDEYYAEPYRNLYHYSVKEGWANDPNGLVKLGDTWHMFYQFYPGGTDWGTMHWYHAASTDLIHWEEKGIAFYPNEYGTMFSGCAVVDADNTSGLFGADGGIILYITANGNGQRVIAAYSEDGDNWSYYRGKGEDGKLNGDDVLVDWREDALKDQAFRDPKVFKYQDKWFMVIAGGMLRIYSSDDMIHWTLESTYADRGDTYQNAAGLRVETECPDLVRLPIEGEDGYKWVLSYCGRRYQVGELTNANGKWEFVADADYAEPAVMNFGNDSYAGMTYFMGSSFNADTQDRVIFYNWMNSWDYCNRVDDLSGNTRFNGTFNLNLELSLMRDRDGKLVLKQTPVEEYAQYVFPAENVALDTSVTAANGGTAQLDFQGDAYLLDVTITPEAGTTRAGVLVRSNGERGVSVDYDFTTDTVTIDRSQLGGFSSSVRFSQAVSEPRDDGSVTLHVYVDKASVEAFSGAYTAAGAAQIYPDPTSNTGAYVFSEGGSSRFDVTITTANSMWK